MRLGRVQARLADHRVPATLTREPYARVQTRGGKWVAIHGSPVANGLSPERGTAVVIETAPVSAGNRRNSVGRDRRPA
jgi:hypothetical protein